MTKKTKGRKARPIPRRAVAARAGPPRNSNESRDIVLAIRRGTVDALVIDGSQGEQVLTLQGSDHPYRVLVETINDGVATLDPSGTILFVNSRFAEIMRLPATNVIGTSLSGHVSPADRETLRQLIARSVASTAQGEIRLDTKEGRSRIVRLALTPVDTNSAIKNICVVATELTELVEANEALRSNEESLQQLSARLLELQDEERRHIARDLHDITGQKLAAQSIALSQVLKRKGLDPESHRLLSECIALSKQIGEEVRTLSYVLHPPLLDELGLSSAVKWYAEGFEQRTAVKVEVDVASEFPRLPPDVEVTLFRIIQESLNNVHRYSGSQKAWVRVRLTREKKIEVEIKDAGKGINPEMLNAASRSVAPIGVGIQGMKERMRQLAGKLEITSGVDRGTRVTATLPLDRINGAAAAEPTPPPIGWPSESSAGKRDRLRKQILIADDHELLRRGIRSMLENEAGWEICGEAMNGQDAVDKAVALQPDLVILDINMPVLNGLAAVRQILRGAPKAKILVFTVHDSDQTEKEVRAAGGHAYLSKNNASQDLLRIVRDLLEGSASLSASSSAAASAVN
ncbi:MAG: response regulator [Candidatus Acidiferrales bacterium]